MDHARHTTLELRLDRDHEPLAAHRDQLILGTSALRQGAQASAQTVLDGSMLPLHRSPDAAKLRRGIVVERTVRLDLPPQHTEQRREVMLKQRLRERFDRRPGISRGSRIGIDQLPPGCYTLDHDQQIPYLGRLKGCPFDTRHLQLCGGVEQTPELEAAARRQHAAT